MNRPDPPRTPFDGVLQEEGTGETATTVSGGFRWLDDGRITGDLVIFRNSPTDVFDRWNVGSFRGRVARLAIPGVGLSPVRIHSDGKTRGDGTTPITFEAWSPPVPIATRPELADALRTPIADALEQVGLSDLAALAKSAAVALNGFTAPPPRGGQPPEAGPRPA